MQDGTTGNQDPVSQRTGEVNLNEIYPPAPLDQRKRAILNHHMFIDKTLLVAFFVVLVVGVLIAKFDSSAVVKTIGSGMAGGAIGALANRMKDGKLSPD